MLLNLLLLGKLVMDGYSRKTSLRMFTYGLYVLTSKYKDDFCGSTITWVTQTSFEPPMISVCIKRDSGTFHIVKNRKEFVLNILGHKQKNLAASFFKSTIVNNSLINNYEYFIENDLPVLKAAPAFITCKVIDIIEKGDHPLFLSKLTNAIVNNETKPLKLSDTEWNYGG